MELTRVSRSLGFAASFVSKTGGVGSLPGTPNEAGVAVLPDEKQEMQREGLGDQGIGKVEQSESMEREGV